MEIAAHLHEKAGKFLQSSFLTWLYNAGLEERPSADRKAELRKSHKDCFHAMMLESQGT